jgi:ComF family protein
VSLHLKRLRQRGYNQAVEIARPIARHQAFHLNTTTLQRIRNTPPQQGLTAVQRSINLSNAFALLSQVLDQKILLVDDVMTTGETICACCRTLLAGGALEVQVAVLGHD